MPNTTILFASKRVEDGIWETPREDTPKLAMQFPRRFWIGADGLEGTINLGQELVPQTTKLLVVSPIGLEGIGLSFGPEKKLAAHPFRWIRARTSAQGEPSDGSRS